MVYVWYTISSVLTDIYEMLKLSSESSSTEIIPSDVVEM